MIDATPATPDAQFPFVSAPPRVRLVNAFARPYDNAVATARTCYSPRIVTPEDVAKSEKARAARDAIAASTYLAGHHTTLQHATFQFTLENVSRQLIWSFLHAHPFYNSEQVSQRYVAVKPESVIVPRLRPRDEALYLATVREQMACYEDLVGLLEPPVSAAYFDVFPARRKRPEEAAGAIRKRCQELARYALPIGTFAHLYHTVSGLTLHRYHRLSQMLDVPTETRWVVEAMIAAVGAHDPEFFARIEDPIPLHETHEYRVLLATVGVGLNADARAFRDEFDGALGGRISRLVGATTDAPALVARAVRTVLGLPSSSLDDATAIAWVMDAGKNLSLGGALNLTAHGKLTRALAHAHYTFQKKLSHAADSQDQRHRLTPASRPVLSAQYVGGAPDVIVPPLLQAEERAATRFAAAMTTTFGSIDALLDGGVAPESALYLLPNAFPIRYEESGDLLAFSHKWTTRLCYTAQEEIWRASVEEVRQVRDLHPELGRHLAPPCGVRRDAGLRPLCPEGERYCGVPVWRLTLDAYQRSI